MIAPEVEPRAVGRLERPPGRRPAGTGTLGLWLFLGSLSVFFLAALAGLAYLRLGDEPWHGFRLPAGLWISTALIAAGSASAQLSLRRIRRGRTRAARRALLATLGLGLVFLASQLANWTILWSANVTARSSLFGFTFYMLTSLHAVHVTGGLLPLAVTAARAGRGAYSWAAHGGIRRCVIYWHFIGGVWLVLLAALWLAG